MVAFDFPIDLISISNVCFLMFLIDLKSKVVKSINLLFFIFHLLLEVENNNDESNNEKQHCIHDQDHVDLVGGVDQQAQLPQEGVLLHVRVYIQHRLGDDGAPFPLGTGALLVGRNGEHLNEVVRSANTDHDVWDLQRAISRLARVGTSNHEFIIVEGGKDSTEGSRPERRSNLVVCQHSRLDVEGVTHEIVVDSRDLWNFVSFLTHNDKVKH